MTLAESDLRRLLFAVVELHNRRPGPPRWTADLIRLLRNELELSRTRQPEDTDLQDSTHDIGTREVAEMLGWHIRRVQRNYKQLGGVRVGNSFVFHRATVLEHLRGAAA